MPTVATICRWLVVAEPTPEPGAETVAVRTAVHAAVRDVLAARSPGVAVRVSAADSDLDAAGIIATALPQRTVTAGGQQGSVSYDAADGVTVSLAGSRPVTVDWEQVAKAMRAALTGDEVRQAALFAARVADPAADVDQEAASSWVNRIADTAAVTVTVNPQ